MKDKTVILVAARLVSRRLKKKLDQEVLKMKKLEK
jgi:hypothetical protein